MRARGTRAIAVGGFAACAMVLAAASFAWACEAGIFAGTPAITANRGSVVVGTTQVQVTGRGWTNGEQVILRWGDETGAQVGSGLPSGKDGVFTTSAAIPAVADGDSYRLFAVQAGGKAYGLPFRVTPTPGDDTEQPRTGSQNTTNGVALADPDASPSGDPSPASTATPAAATPRLATGGSTSSAAGTAVAGEPVRASDPVPAADRTAATAGRPSLLPGAVAAPLAADRKATTVAAPAEVIEAAASVKTASGDLWSGFSQAKGSSGPGLASLPAAGSGSSSNLAVGLGLLSAGLVALFAGFGVAEVNRRRLLVTRKAG